MPINPLNNNLNNIPSSSNTFNNNNNIIWPNKNSSIDTSIKSDPSLNEDLNNNLNNQRKNNSLDQFNNYNPNPLFDFSEDNIDDTKLNIDNKLNPLYINPIINNARRSHESEVEINQLNNSQDYNSN